MEGTLRPLAEAIARIPGIRHRAHQGFDLGFYGMNMRYFVLVKSLRSPVTSTLDPDPGVA